jgi:GDPmannose 4,6-dehydratase
LGNISIRRDWGWAPEYIEAMWQMMQQDTPDDFVIATGESYSLEEFVAAAFSYVRLNWRDHVVMDESLLRPTDLMVGHGNPAKAREKLRWQARYKMHDVVRLMVDAQLNSDSLL